jgi:FkbM family methyltransferase
VAVDPDEFGPRQEIEHGPSPQWQLSWRLIHPGDTVFDVGANIGLWGLRAARRAGPGGAVHCFEPLPRNAERLLSNAALNRLGNLSVHAVALADRSGRATFYEPAPGDSGKGRLAPREGLHPGPEVELATLDAVRRDLGVERLDLLKLDVEGGEEMVLRGGLRTLASGEAPIVIFESARELADSMASSCAAVKRLLADQGYEIYRHGATRLEPVPIERDHWQDDLFALKPVHLEGHAVLAELVS